MASVSLILYNPIVVVFFCFQYGTSALVWASRKGHSDVVKTLLCAGANVNTVGTVGF